MFTGSHSYINKLRIIGDHDDSLAFQLRLQSLLSAADFSVPGVPPSSIVCIRSLPDPRPHTLRLVRSELEGAEVWRGALTKAIAGKVSHAERPAAGVVLENAECVLFADKAEMLACLASDWLSGSLGRRWWWKTLLRAVDSSDVVKTWRDHPHYVPAALDQLSRQQQAQSFVSALADGECRELVLRVVHSFSIHELSTLCDVSLDVISSSSAETKTSPRRSSGKRAFEEELIASPWESVFGEPAPSGLSPERQRLLGIALTIIRAPSFARTREFARAIERWQEAVVTRLDVTTEPPPSGQTPIESRGSAQAQPESADRKAQATLPMETHASVPEEREESHISVDVHSSDVKQVGAGKPPSSESRALIETSQGVRVEAAVESILRFPLESTIAPSQSSSQPFTPDESEQPAAVDDVIEPPWIEIETQLGGLFYLINLALYLNLYGDFTMPAATEIDLNIWDFVALVGKEMTGEADAKDPIWAWLAEMSGVEEREALGESEETRDKQRLPPDWLSLMMPDLRARLRVALGCQSDDDAARMLCRHYARIRATGTHVDVFFGLADLPLEIRFAGLDRDPGWVPAAGRFIAFHFD